MRESSIKPASPRREPQFCAASPEPADCEVTVRETIGLTPGPSTRFPNQVGVTAHQSCALTEGYGRDINRRPPSALKVHYDALMDESTTSLALAIGEV